MGFRKHLQNLFKKTVQKIFLLLYGKVYCHNEKVKNNFIEHKVNNILIGNTTSPVINNMIYEIENCRIYTDTNEHVAIIKDNIIIPKISYQQILGELKESEFNKVLNIGTPRLIKQTSGITLSLVQGGSGENYFHFLFDIIAKLAICQQKIPLNKINNFYVHGDIEWQNKIFALFGINKKQLINSKIYRHIKIDKLIAITHPWYHKGYVQNEITNIPDWIIFWLREKFLNLSKKFDCNDKIFIDRSESKFKHCQLINNNQVIAFLESKGFTSYKIGELDFLEQVYLFNNAKIIIGPHGAAFSNIIFSKPKTEIIEIIPDNHPSIKCQKLSKTLDLNYTKIIKPKIALSDQSSGDMDIKLKELKTILEKLKLL
jgi:capsular polysaccharide biosynthesis protein